uniref:Uncharacterized protein n=1 Tax=Oryza rufipogon TaxID=4529 RepID=A0A0E0R7T3_ORYRU
MEEKPPPIVVKPCSPSSLSRSILLSLCRSLSLLTLRSFIHCSNGNATSPMGARERALNFTGAGIVVVRNGGDHPETSPLTINTPLKSSLKALKNLME